MITYNKEKAKQEYDQRYSTFSFVPGYQYELAFINRIWRVLAASGVLNNKSSNLLDLGSGFGFKTYALSKKVGEVTGIDISSKAILISDTLNDNPKLEFICTELEGFSPEKKYEMVTAFGLSNFNVSDVKHLSEEIRETLAKLLASGGLFVLYSFTDFSGKAPTGWYYHTRSELKELVRNLQVNPCYEVKLLFPHRKRANYKGGAKNLFFELFKLFFQRKKDYLLTIRLH